MKRLIIFLLLFAAIKVAGQTIGHLRFDTVMIYKVGGTGELALMNSTKDTLGILTNYGNGRTRFIKSRAINDSTIVVGLDTMIVRGTGTGSGTSNINEGTGFPWLNEGTQVIKRVADSWGIKWDSISTANTLTAKPDTGASGVATQYDLSQKLDSIHIYTAADPDPDSVYAYKSGDSTFVGFIPKGGGAGDTTITEGPVHVKEGVGGEHDTLAVRYDTTTITIRTTGVNDSALTVNTANISTVQRLIDSAAKKWSITGNAGTIDGTNFLGTTDNVALNFRVNNERAGRINPNFLYTAFGYQAGNTFGGDRLNVTAIGHRALTSNTFGDHITAVGAEALESNTTGDANTAIGYRALEANTTGNNNAAFGFQAMQSNLTGTNNTAMGNNALGDNNNASQTTAVGSSAFELLTSGSYNTAIGYDAGGSASITDSTVFIGGASGFTNTTGKLNTYIGVSTGIGITTGSYNTIIGARVIGLSPTLSKNIILSDGEGDIRLQFDNTGALNVDLQADVTDSITYKPWVQDASGNVRRFGYWPGGGGGGGGGSAGSAYGIDSTVISGTTGSVLFVKSGSVLGQDNGNFFWNDTDKRLGLGTATPDRQLHIEAADAITNAITFARRISHITSGTATTGFGLGEEIELENASGTNVIGATWEYSFSDATNATEDVQAKLRLIRAGSIADAIVVQSTGATAFSNAISTAAGASVTSGQNVILASAGILSFSSRARVTSPADGILTATNTAGSDFTRFNLGGISASFPAWQRSTTKIIAMLADGSARTNVGVLDEAYNPTTWDANEDVPTKNAIRDEVETIRYKPYSQTASLVTNTSDATPTNMSVLYGLTTLPDNSNGWFKVTLTGNGQNGASTHSILGIKYYSYHKTGGTLTLDAADVIVADKKGASVSTATWQVIVSSNQPVIEVTGVTAITMVWGAAVEIVYVVEN